MAGPDQILFIRHGEHHSQAGITEDGLPNEQSLNARGWQRAGALVAYFSTRRDGGAIPETIYASAIGKDSESRRPQQTIAPLLAVLRTKGRVDYCDAFTKQNVEKLADDLMTRSGVVLIAWEHSVIPKILARLGVKGGPSEWPSDRYDLVWSIERDGAGWIFQQTGQSLLTGDR